MSEKMREILDRDFLVITPVTYKIIEEESRSVDWRKIKASEWIKIQHLYFMVPSEMFDGGFLREELMLDKAACYLSRDGTVLYVPDRELDLLEIIKRCGKNLITLHIENYNLKQIDVSRFKGLKTLWLRHERMGIDHVAKLTGLEHLSGLEDLRLEGELGIAELSLGHMKGLRFLHLDGINRLQSITGLDAAKGLRELRLLNLLKLSRINLQQATKLRTLQIVLCHRIKGLPSIESMQCLECLILCCYPLGEFFDVSILKKLRVLSLVFARNLQQISGMDKLSELTSLDITETGIRTIPEGIRDKELERLNLSGLELDELPDWLPELGLDFFTENKRGEDGIILKGTKIKDVDMSIFDQPREMIVEWFQNRQAGDVLPLNELKVVFLGDGDAGKSHTIARLLNDGGAPEDYTDQSTPGIVIKNKEYTLDGRQIRLHYWDFGGQEILHSMHRIFLTGRTLYVVLVNARDETQDARASYWLHNIQSFAGDAPVVLVLNKMDQNPNASLNEPVLRSRYAGLKRIVKLSALKDSPDDFNRKLQDVLLEEVRATGNLDIRWPKHWFRVKQALEQMQSHYIYGDRYLEICRECRVENSQRELLHWFNDLGVSFCCTDDFRLENYVILKPSWITNALYIIIFNDCPEAKNGLIPHSAIHALLSGERPGVRRVLEDVRYNWDQTQYVLNVIRRFQLSFQGTQGYEFIPMLCRREAMPVAQEYEDDPDTLEFRMKFDYLPNNVLHRLMVERQRELCMDQVWRTGALFRQEGTGLSAVVTIDGDLLRIFIRRGDPMHRPNTYLSMLIANVERICRSLNLRSPEKELVYKREGKQDIFSFEMLMEMLRAGVPKTFSRAWQTLLPIEDIMNQSAPVVLEEEKRVLESMLRACKMLQANQIYWGREENERNTYLRDTLRMAGYIVHDQTLQGRSASGRRQGEIDLDICTPRGEPWSLCEALRIRDGSKTDWNRHLNKLLDNYNPNSAPFLFLVTYVDCEKEKFGGIWARFEEHIRKTDTERFRVQERSWESIEEGGLLRAAACRYECGTYSPKVYHIFLQMGQ